MKTDFKITSLVFIVCVFVILAVSIMLMVEQSNGQKADETTIENNETTEVIIETEVTIESEEGETTTTLTEQTETDTTNVETKETITTNEDTEIETETETETETEEVIVEVEPPFYLSDYERKIAECVVMGEAGGESYEGQVLVAQCLLNGCIKEGMQPSQLRIKYKYSGWRDESSDSVKRAVSAVFDEGYKITEEFILYFYAPRYSEGRWHETQRFVIEVGGHRFFAEWDE